MPTYEFACPACHERFEVRMTLKEREGRRPVPCPRCGEENTVRVYSSFAVGRGTGPQAGGGFPGCGPPGCCGGGSADAR